MHPPEERDILVRSQGSAHARGARAVEHRSYAPRDRVRLPACAHGAVAQSGEHLVCTQAVVGSMPTGSTCSRSSAEESAWLRTRRSGVRVPPGTLCCLCAGSSRDRSGGRSPGSYPEGRRFESDSRNFARVVELPVDTLAREASGLRGPCEFDPRPEHHTHALVVESPVDTPASEAGARDEHASSTLARGTATSRWLER